MLNIEVTVSILIGFGVVSAQMVVRMKVSNIKKYFPIKGMITALWVDEKITT